MGHPGRDSQNILKSLRTPERLGTIAILVLGAAALLPFAAVAQAASKVAQAPATSGDAHHAASNETGAGHVTVIILDMSGSMAQNDPEGLRCSAANAYIDLSGPGDFVGVVGLDGTSTGGPDNFGTPVNWGLSPREMATVNDREALRNAIAEKSNGCRPDSYTPTYATLVEAESMLAGATQGTSRSGSVILLTDGTPDPDTNAQISATTQQLVPQFKSHGWPIDAIALGSDQSFHPFLSGLASATSGRFYDDGHGVVPGASPLNIASFFVDIFRLRNGRSVGPTIAPTQLSGGVVARNFSIGQYVSELDVIVVKDSPAAQVSVLAPNGQHIPPPGAGAFISSDPHYAIISLDSPQPGSWELDVGGTGLFLMDSLKVSALTLSITSPATAGALALGQPFTVSAQLSDQGVPISGGRFNLSGTVSFVGNSASSFAEDILLSNQTGTGTYSVPLTIPISEPTGSYEIQVQAHSATEDVLSAQAVVRLDLFPSALLIGRNGPTTEPVTANVTQWDKPLELLYGLPVVSFFGGWALGGIPAQPSAVIKGQIELNGRPYASATVSGTATRAGTTSQVPVTFTNDGGGKFHLIFPSSANGTYTLALTTQGAFDISHGDLTNVSRVVDVTLVPDTAAQRLQAYLVTLFYLLMLAFLVLVFRYMLAPKPRGVIISIPGGADEFARARRPQAFFSPSTVESGQMGLDPGLLFRFRRGGRVSVRGTNARANYRQGDGSVPMTWFSAANADLSSSDGRVHYHIEAGRRGSTTSGQLDTRSELARRILGSRTAGSRDEDDDDRRQKRGFLFFARRPANDDEDDDRGSGRKRAVSRNSWSRDRDDDRPERTRRRRSRSDDDW